MDNQVKPKVLGYWPGKRWKQARAVFDTNAPSPTIVAAMGGEAPKQLRVCSGGEKMNMMDKRIADRVRKGGKLPTAFCAWHNKDVEICPAITTLSGPVYTKKTGVVVFEYE